MVCTVSFRLPYQLHRLNEETLQELWKADLPNEVGAYQALEQDADNVYVLGQGRALAFRIADGKRLWARDNWPT